MLTKEELEKRIREMELKRAINSEKITHYSISEKMLKALILRSKGLTLAEIGERLNVCRERARQLINDAKSKIRWLNKLMEKEDD